MKLQSNFQRTLRVMVGSFALWSGAAETQSPTLQNAKQADNRVRTGRLEERVNQRLNPRIANRLETRVDGRERRNNGLTVAPINTQASRQQPVQPNPR